MSSEKPAIRKLPFAEEKASRDFYQEVIRLLIREVDNRRKKYVPTENFQVFHHGLAWNFQRQEAEGFKPHSGELEKVSTDCVIKTDRIVANDMTLIADFVSQTATQMEAELVRRLTSEMGAVAEETGNSVSISKTGSVADAFLEIAKKIQVSVDRNGKVR